MAYCWPFIFQLTQLPHEGVVMIVYFPTDLLVYRSAIYPQGVTFKYGVGGRLGGAQRAVATHIDPSGQSLANGCKVDSSHGLIYQTFALAE